MRMILISTTLSILLSVGACKNSESHPLVAEPVITAAPDTAIRTGAEQTERWLPNVQGKTVALVVNQTSVIGNRHLVDTLVSLGVNISAIFAPEHGFRGTEDAGATILNAKDTATGIPVISLYGAKKKPSFSDLADAEVVIFDIQDVGARFYTYISTLHYVMEACAEFNKPLIVLDRPNPNGFYIDGPVLESGYTSFVGMHPVPVVHGMTIGEYARMINGEGWLPNKATCSLEVITCAHYDHSRHYTITIPPSPNLRTMRAIYLYPSLCFFEGTQVSVGRGTDKPFELYGSPHLPAIKASPGMYPAPLTFIPRSGPGAKSPPFMQTNCQGFDLSGMDTELLRDSVLHKQLYLQPLLDTYAHFDDRSKFFLENNFFNNLAGNAEFMMQIKGGLTEEEIRMSWADDLKAFKQVRKKYLLYPDFE